jgi:N-hydroxyarylamine O-acetyltransferase
MANDLLADPGANARSLADAGARSLADADEWRADRLDLDAYLRRIAHTGRLAPDGQTLAALHRAHLAAIPFENLDVILGRGISVDLDHVQAKLVARGRGGYCYEHAILFGAALSRLGFDVDRLLARTPLPLAATGPQRQGAWQYELVRGRDGAWRLREHDGEQWTTIQTFTEEPQYLVDVEVANYNTATNPHSPFVQRPIVVQKGDTWVRRLLGREYTLEQPGQPARQRMLTDGEYAEVLRGEFGLELAPAEVTALVAALPSTPPRTEIGE